MKYRIRITSTFKQGGLAFTRTALSEATFDLDHATVRVTNFSRREGETIDFVAVMEAD